ncbi:MAG: hypothetical protein ABIN37_07095, partial [Burkholderiaceae bacterium]
YTTANFSGLVDLADPYRPRLVGRRFGPAPLADAVINGRWAYLAGHYNFAIYDLSNLDSPRRVALKEDLSWHPASLVAIGRYVVMGQVLAGDRSGPGLVVFDVGDPAHPRKVGSVTTRGSMSSLAADGRYLYALSNVEIGTPGNSTLVVFDGIDPTDIKQVAAFDLGGPARRRHGRLAWLGGQIVVADDVMGLRVVDVSDPLNPHLVGTAVAATQSPLVTVVGDRAFTTTGNALGPDLWEGFPWLGSAVQAIDLTVPDKPVRRATWTVRGVGSWLRVVASGGLLVALVQRPTTGDEVGVKSTTLWVIDPVDPVRPRTVGSVPVPITSYLSQVSDGTVFPGPPGWAYLAKQRALWPVDLRTPGQPRLEQPITVPDDVVDMALDAQGAYLMLRGGVLRAVDLSEPGKPRLGHQVLLGDDAFAMALRPGWIFATGGQVDAYRLIVLNRSTPELPSIAATFDLPERPIGILARGDWLYIPSVVPASTRHVITVDAHDPTHPQITLFKPSTSNGPIRIEGDDETTWTQTVNCGLDSCSGYVGVLDLTDPSRPAIGDTDDLSGHYGHYPIDLAAVGAFGYAPYDSDGLVVWQDTARVPLPTPTARQMSPLTPTVVATSRLVPAVPTATAARAMASMAATAVVTPGPSATSAAVAQHSVIFLPVCTVALSSQGGRVELSTGNINEQH